MYKIEVNTILQRKFNIYWLIILILSLLSLITLTLLSNTITQERKAHQNKVQVIALADSMRKFSYFLTSESRNFIVTGNVLHLQHYWHKIYTHKNRQILIIRLKDYPFVTQKDTNLLSLAKRNSELLSQTEMRAFKLVLTAYDVPKGLYIQPIKQIILMPKEKKLSPVDKIKLARSLLFNDAYELKQRKVMQPIDEFIHNIIETMRTKVDKIKQKSKLLLFLLGGLLTILILTIISIVWIKK
jgi:CRISPR/Cas system CSM-associated protein Csm5 (group 7 of RAMP superfamily)